MGRECRRPGEQIGEGNRRGQIVGRLLHLRARPAHQGAQIGRRCGQEHQTDKRLDAVCRAAPRERRREFVEREKMQRG